MSESNRLILQLVTNILVAGFATIFGFAQFGEYLTDRRLRHIAAAIAWWVLVPVFILRTAGVMKPPLLDTQTIMDGAAIGWAVALVFGVMWGVLRLTEKRREAAARRRLGLDTKDERETDVNDSK